MLPSLLPCHTDDGTMATSPHSSDDSTPHSSQFSTHSSESPLPPRSRKPPTHTPTSFPSREDCWSEDATFTLIDAWGERYLDLKRGNLRQNDWQQVAAAVNSRHAHTRKLRRTDVQCKNRMDTVKKKYKIEKARVSESSGDYVSPWPFFVRLDSLIGVTVKPSPPAVGTRRQTSELPPPPSSVPKSALPPPPYSVPVRPRSKRPAPAPIPFPAPAIPSATRRLRTRVPPPTPESPQVDDAISRRKFLAMTEAAAAVAEAEEQSDNSVRSCREGGAGEGYGRLAEAVERFGEIYERVEGEKQRVLIELEKGRMQFAKDLEIQRMKLIMESQLRLERMLCSKRLRRSPH